MMEEETISYIRIPISEILSKFNIKGEVITFCVPVRHGGPVGERHLLVRTLEKP